MSPPYSPHYMDEYQNKGLREWAIHKRLILKGLDCRAIAVAPGAWADTIALRLYPLFFVSVASKGFILHQNCAHFARVARGRWAQARTGIGCNCTQKLLYQRDMGSSRRISRNMDLQMTSLGNNRGRSIRPRHFTVNVS